MKDPKMQKLEAASPEAQSADLVAENVAQLKALFPELVTEGPNGPAVNLDVLKALVGDATLSDAEEKYGLNWHGKRAARQLALTPSTGTLRPCPDESVGWGSTKNLMIEGDNLEVLKLLQKSYAGKVKLAYLDPPYNTGKDFVYPDRFKDSIRNYLEVTGQLDGSYKISSNSEASGRFHTDWLNMMYPRLKLVRNLLTSDGVLCISINDKEQHSLKHVLNEVFGEENFIAQLVWDKNHSAQAGLFKVYHEYVLVYARSIDEVKTIKAQEAEDFEAGAMKKESARHPLQKFKFPKGTRFDAPDGFELNGTWGETEKVRLCEGRMIAADGKLSEDVVLEAAFTQANQMKQYFYGDRNALVDSRGQRVLEFYFTGTGKLKVSKERGVFTPPTVQRWGMQGEVSTELAGLFGLSAPPLETPKSLTMMQNLIGWFTTADDLVVDFFAGSGTTGHATMRTSAESGQPRRFILVQIPELCAEGSEAAKAGFRTIADICKKRLALAAQRIRSEFPDAEVDTGFRSYRLDTSNITAWSPKPADLVASIFDHAEHIVPGRTAADVLSELLLKLGLDLCVQVTTRTIAGKTVHSVAGGVLIACLEPSIGAPEIEALAQGIIAWHKEMAPAGDTTCVFRDSAFADDVAKTNMAAILEQNGIANVRSL